MLFREEATSTYVPPPDMTLLAWQGQSVPGGGTLATAPFYEGPQMNASGQIAFIGRVAGSERNHGLFMADEEGLHPIVMGCGGGGGSGNPGSGCGDSSPIGGTFSGLFRGSALAPSINDSGDILFLSDIHGGSSYRGLFLYLRSESPDLLT